MNPIDLVVTVCAVLSPATCEEQHLVFNWAGSPHAMRDGRAALHRAMGRRASEMAGGALALRISAPERQGVSGSRYFVQSFRSLSAIENTASALISMSRTTHCRELG